MDSLASLAGTVIGPCRSTSSQTCDDFDELLLLLEPILELVALRSPAIHRFWQGSALRQILNRLVG